MLLILLKFKQTLQWADSVQPRDWTNRAVSHRTMSPREHLLPLGHLLFAYWLLRLHLELNPFHAWLCTSKQTWTGVHSIMLPTDF